MNNLQSDIDNAICDGYGCYSKVNSELVVKVGLKKTISLSLCEACKRKLNDRGRTDDWATEQRGSLT